MLAFPVFQCNLAELLTNCSAMRYTDGEKLRARTIRIVLKRSMQCLAQALEYLHENMIRQVDLKPSNILYRRFDNVLAAHVYLADFGASKILEHDGSTTGTTGVPAFATCRFAPPEVLNYERRGRAADIFSLGCVFYEMLLQILCVNEHKIKSGYAMSLPELHSVIAQLCHHNGIVEGLRIPRSQISRLGELILKMTQHDQRDRPIAEYVAHTLGANDCCYLEPEDPAESTGPANREDELSLS
jgi:serine/threonine protein kinase